MSYYDRQNQVISGISRAFTWPGNLGEFLGLWLLASLGSWFLGGFPMVFVLLAYWLLGLDPNSEASVGLTMTGSTFLAGLVLMLTFWLSPAERYIRVQAKRSAGEG